MRFANTGNDVGSYRLRVVDNLPENWSANFSETDTNITNLSSDISDGDLDGEFGASTEHIEFISFNINTDPVSYTHLTLPTKA